MPNIAVIGDAVIGLALSHPAQGPPKEMTVMTLYAALDVALEKTALCIVDREGAVVLEASIATDPDVIAESLAPFRLRLARLGLEAGPLSEWLVRGLQQHGLQAVLMETRHVRAALSARVAKTDG